MAIAGKQRNSTTEIVQFHAFAIQTVTNPYISLRSTSRSHRLPCPAEGKEVEGAHDQAGRGPGQEAEEEEPGEANAVSEGYLGSGEEEARFVNEKEEAKGG